MAKLSVVIPSRDERFLVPTIDDIFRNRRGETEVVAVLDSDKWPDDWAAVTARHPDLHTIHNGKSLGMRPSINRGVASAISRGARYILKLDGHCSLDEGFDVKLAADYQPNWVVVPRRKRLDAENWTFADVHKPDIDYHYLSYPDDPNDFGGPGLNGKIWPERALARADILIDEEMSSQGSGWFMAADYFVKLELMDAASYGTFWNEMQEIGLKCWLSGGQLMVNKKTWYAHLHKGRKYGRGYRLSEAELQKGAGYTKRWMFNDAWAGQTLPFASLIERFWPVPTWPEDWEAKLYAERKPRSLVAGGIDSAGVDVAGGAGSGVGSGNAAALVIHSARYGELNAPMPFIDHSVDVTKRVRELVKGDSLDIVVNNSTLTPNDNPFRGKKKVLLLTYSLDGGDPVTVEREEKDWLIIGRSERYTDTTTFTDSDKGEPYVPTSGEAGIFAAAKLGEFGETFDKLSPEIKAEIRAPLSPTALTDLLIRRFAIPTHRLRGPMPIELPTFHRNDLAALFAELGFSRGAEIGVAEGKYSEVLLRANPDLELLCIDPWGRYEGNAQQKTTAKHDFARSETARRIAGTKAQMIAKTSMRAVEDVEDGSLDFCYIDGNHSFDYVMEDLIVWSRKVRSGGIVSGDDYYYLDPKRWGAGPVEAVQAYTSAHRITPWFICNAHRSVDYFWVKP